MSKCKMTVLLTTMFLLTIVLTGLPAEPAYSEEAPAWAMKIMKNITITGLTYEGERLEVSYLGKGSWSSTVTDVCYFVLWRMLRIEGSWRRDLQAHIELAKVGEGVYVMEVYHSWPPPTITMPYSFTVVRETDYLTILRITAEV